MLEKRFHVEIRTPEKLIFEGDVVGVKAPGVFGSFEILPGHIPFLTVLEPGEVRINELDTPQSLATNGGIFEVLRTGATVLLETAEWAYEVDIERTEAARQRAVERLRTRSSDIDIKRAEAAFARATNRLRVARQQ